MILSFQDTVQIKTVMPKACRSPGVTEGFGKDHLSSILPSDAMHALRFTDSLLMQLWGLRGLRT